MGSRNAVSVHSELWMCTNYVTTYEKWVEQEMLQVCVMT